MVTLNGSGIQSTNQVILSSMHRANIDKYQSLLKGNLTVLERQLVERRLGEEKKALFEIIQSVTQIEFGSESFVRQE